MQILSKRQHSSEWFSSRVAKVTGSRVSDALCFLKNGSESKARSDYRTQIVAETLTGSPSMDGYLSPEMQWGNENEALARSAYEVFTGKDVDLVGFATHDSIDRFGGSCDGLVGSDGIIEIKCAKTSTHIRWMLAGVVPAEHEPQMLAYLSITGRSWCDFVSYDPRLPMRHQLFIARLERDDAKIAEMEAGVVQFLSEVEAMIAEINRRNPAIAEETRIPQVVAEGITDADLPIWYRQMQASL